MSARMYRGQLDRKRRQRLDSEKRAGEYRTKESKKRTEAATARSRAAKASNPTIANSRMREAERRESEAEAAAKEAARWQKKASDYAREEASLQSKVAKAEQTEAVAADRNRARAQQQSEARAVELQRTLERRVTQAELVLDHALREFPPPKPEQLRVLILGASSEGDLRVGREAKRIRSAVESALHRDYIELDVRPAATTDDLLDGISKFRPHVVHFSGHSNEDLIVFEEDVDEPHKYGAVVTAAAFARAVKGTDDAPLLVFLNSCKSAPQARALVEGVVPFAIGMADSIGDGDAITYAARFYATVANGQSIASSHAAGQAALDLAGLDSAELPVLEWADDVDPSAVVMVRPSNGP